MNWEANCPLPPTHLASSQPTVAWSCSGAGTPTVNLSLLQVMKRSCFVTVLLGCLKFHGIDLSDPDDAFSLA